MVRLLLIAVLWCSPLWAYAANITAQFDRNPVSFGDAVSLSFTASGIVSAEPDFAPLEQDFEIRGRSQSNNISMINGQTNVQTVWELTLYPRKTGTIHVPAIRFGSDSSSALSLQVTDQPSSAANGSTNASQNDDVLLEVEVEPKQPYVQQQIIITQRLYYAVSLQQTWRFSPPSIETGKGSLQQLGNYTMGSRMHNGRNYKTLEARFILVPQQSGELKLGRASFEGMLDHALSGHNGNGFDPFADPFGLLGRPIKRFSQPITLEIKAQPAAYQGKQWLPAKSISLNVHWQTPPDKLKAGEPVNLTLGVVADGLTAEQLPKLELDIPAGIKAYANQPDLNNEINNDGVIGIRQEKWVIVSPYNGEFTLPEIKIDWWNSKTGQAEVAKLDPVKMVFTGGQAAHVTNTPMPAPAPPAANGSQNTPPANATPSTRAAENSWSWDKLAAAFLLFWVLISLGWLLWRWFKPSKANPLTATGKATSVATPTKAASTQALWQQLEQACLQHQPQAAHDRLIHWMEVGLNMHPPLLAHLRAQASPALQAEIDALNTALYARSNTPWEGNALLQALQAFKPISPTLPSRQTAGLAKLYPD